MEARNAQDAEAAAGAAPQATPGALWAQIEPLLPARKPHPLGCHNPRVDDRRAVDALLFRLRTGCQWNALSATGLCSSSSAHRRFQEWRAAGVFLDLWRRGLTGIGS